MEPPIEVLEDLDLRFISSAPKDTVGCAEHLMFLVEHAYWFYEDHVREKSPGLKHYANLREFAYLIFNSSPLLKPHAGEIESFLERFRAYKRIIPVYGAILLDSAMERVLLVRGMKSASGWGFPQGKINQGEPPEDCAAREVHEETGIAIDHLINPEHKIQVKVENKPYCLFIVEGIDPETTVVGAKTKGEIGAYGWHYLSDLPSTTDEANRVYMSTTGDRHRFYMVSPFIKRLRGWITVRKAQLGVLPATSGASTAAAGGGGGTKGKDKAKRAAVAGDVPLNFAPEQAVAEAGGGSMSWDDFRFDREAIMQHFYQPAGAALAAQ